MTSNSTPPPPNINHLGLKPPDCLGGFGGGGAWGGGDCGGGAVGPDPYTVGPTGRPGGVATSGVGVGPGRSGD